MGQPPDLAPRAHVPRRLGSAKYRSSAWGWRRPPPRPWRQRARAVRDRLLSGAQRPLLAAARRDLLLLSVPPARCRRPRSAIPRTSDRSWVSRRRRDRCPSEKPEGDRWEEDDG